MKKYLQIRTNVRIIALRDIRRRRCFLMKCVFDSKRIEMGNRIRTLRKRRVGSQSEFAEKLDVSVITISRIENGMTKIDAELLLKMSEVLQVSVNSILGIGQQEYYI